MNPFALILFIGLNFILLQRYNRTIRNHRRSLIICLILISGWLYCPVNPSQLQSLVIDRGSIERVSRYPQRGIYLDLEYRFAPSPIWCIVSPSTNTTFVIREFFGVECQLFFSNPNLVQGSVIFTGHIVSENDRLPSGRSRTPINYYRYTIDLVS
ncbi:MAG: hypothetical protein ACXACU_08675, partial [Candidatus Hodarchaeales archaeon]